MSRKTRSNRDKSRSAKLHTVLIDDPIAMWHKLLWDIDCFENIQRAAYSEDEDEPLAYAALNVCIAATSLGDWVVTDWGRKQREKGLTFKRSDFLAQILEAVPVQRICLAIANTAKHSEYQEREWTGGYASLSFEPSDEHSPGGLTLYYRQDGQQTSAFASFDALGQTWGRLLVELGYGDISLPSPRWWKQKMRRIFPPIDIEDQD
jgi:hypothetical protein